MKSTVLAFVVLTPVLLTSSVTIAAPSGPISTISCTLTERTAGPAIVQPATVNFAYGDDGALKSVTLKTVKGGRILALVRTGMIAYRVSSEPASLNLLDYQSKAGIQKCDFTEAALSLTDGISIKAKCDILPESGMRAKTEATFEMMVAPQKIQDYAILKVGTMYAFAGYELSKCTAK